MMSLSLMPIMTRLNINYKISTVSRVLLLLLILSAIVENLATSRYYSTSADSELSSDLMDDYNGNIAKLLFVNRKSCLRRAASCDHRPDDCCDSSICRCNVWGTNCRCSRAVMRVMLVMDHK
ncbi:unnamed protein product [Oppiella nova]|uniref:U8-agatoxin-Ao1a n=1 Tax=Oppiella nova TaxID=334625 RepID=A0A7R9LD71_9ACAR|nr:unnamed protein product [Oppiella nova]CAG2162389.1 unnamed protein product [Oppiella nova]